MKKLNSISLIIFCAAVLTAAAYSPAFSKTRGTIIENFDSGTISLSSYPGEDFHPNSWSLESGNTCNNSPYSLKLYGNTWKVQQINPISPDTLDLWQVAAYIEYTGEVQGVAFMDSLNTLFYSFAGSEELNIGIWETVYQGAFGNYNWNYYHLPIGSDWLARFGYLPNIKKIVYINDRDADPTSVIYFDEIIDITDDQPQAPQVNITFTRGNLYENSSGQLSVDVQFNSEIIDPDSENHQFYWYFGDDSSSSFRNPQHTFFVEDDHAYTVRLEVVDPTNLWGWASCKIDVDAGPSSYPVTVNFVGDIIIARRYEGPGGIIATHGLNGIFDPTLPYLGNNADITVANLECPLTNQGMPHPTKSVVFRGSPANIAGLVHAGIDVVTLANNHSIDYGLSGLQQTQSGLAANGILHSGAGANAYEAKRPVFISKKGINFAFVAASDRTGQYNNYQPYLNAGYNKPGFANLTESNLTEQINSVKSSADIIIVEMHSGSEYSFAPRNSNFVPETAEDEFYSPQLLAPSDGDIDVRRFAIDEGADAVICHHPHIIHGFEVYKNKLIAHSLGNFVFDLNYPETYPSMILDGKIDDSGFYTYSVTPVYIDDYIPLRAEGELGLHILNYLAQKSRDLNTYLEVDNQSVTAEIILDTTAYSKVDHPVNRSVQLQVQSGYRTSQPIKLERLGSIAAIPQISPAADWQFRLGRERVWFGNFEDEGCSLWLLDHNDEYFDINNFFQGARSLCQRRYAGYQTLNTNFEERIRCFSDSSEHTLHTMLKTQNAKNAGILLRQYASRTQSYYLAETNLGTEINGSSDWQFYSNDFTPAAGTKYFDIRLRSQSPASSVGYSWFDNTGIIEWQEWQPWSANTEIINPNDYYWMQVRTSSSESTADINYIERNFSLQPSVANSNKTIVPTSSRLAQNFPNPFNPSTRIRYELHHPGKSKLIIFNSLGQKVRTLINQQQPAGEYTVTWNGKNDQGQLVGSGIYFYRLNTGKNILTKKMILIR